MYPIFVELTEHEISDLGILQTSLDLNRQKHCLFSLEFGN
jgi:hypothetical protein